MRQAISVLQKEAERRLEDLVSIVEKLTANAPDDGGRIRQDLKRLEGFATDMDQQSAQQTNSWAS